MGELRHHVALERVDEADPEDVVTDLGDLGVGRGVGDHRHMGRLGLVGHGDGVGARHLAEDQEHLVLVDEPGGGVGRFLGLALIVVDPDVDLLALDPPGGVDLAQRELDGVPRRDAEGGLGAGERADLTDEDGVSRHSAGSTARGRGRGPARRRTGRRRRGRHLLLAADQGEGTAGQDCRQGGAHGKPRDVDGTGRGLLGGLSEDGQGEASDFPRRRRNATPRVRTTPASAMQPT